MGNHFSGTMDTLSYTPKTNDPGQLESELLLVNDISKSHQWWKADILAYLRRMTPWLFAGVCERCGISERQGLKLASIALRFPPGRRVEGVSVTMHEQVLILPTLEDMECALIQARDNGWCKADLSEYLRANPKGDDGRYPTAIKP